MAAFSTAFTLLVVWSSFALGISPRLPMGCKVLIDLAAPVRLISKSPLLVEAPPRASENPYYVTSKQFVSEAGYEFAKLFFSKLTKNEEVTAVIALGGAEHLGNLLEAYAELKGIKNVKFKYLYLNNNITQDALLGGDGQDLAALMDANHVFDSHLVALVDTGLRGSVFEAIAKAEGDKIKGKELRGFLLHYSTPHNTDRIVPVTALGVSGLPRTDRGRTEHWAWALDYSNHWIKETGPDGQQISTEVPCFQRSHPAESTALVRDDSGKLKLQIRDFKDQQAKQNYEATLSGLVAGLKDAIAREPRVSP